MTRVRSDLSDPVSAIPCGLQARNLGLTVLVPRHGVMFSDLVTGLTSW
jgi:hypothetical protein